uniref:Polyprotein n=1 Tax=Rhodiola betaflexivirus 1 TaxID=2794410 RepID=A0A7T5QZ83_9VIRU|nr:polyprotein [Rhodiola betaflexivirus 1]
MAFSYKNPIEQTINQLPTKYSDQIMSDTADILIEKASDLNRFFSYVVSKEVEEFLCSRGFELAALPTQTHTHPACKMIENQIIFKVVPMLLNKTPSIALMSMRDEKAENLIKRRNISKFGNVISAKAVNSCIDAKDRFRYMDPQELPKNHNEALDRLESECRTNGWFPKVVFMHDEIHFWEPSEIVSFFERFSEIQCLLATVVFPVEILFGEEESKNPRIYTFSLDGDQLDFFPDGYVSEGYTQSSSNSRWPLIYSGLTNGVTSLRVSILYTLGAHHLISIDRGEAKSGVSFFEKPTCLLKSELEVLGEEICSGLVERGTMSSILLYLSCLKSPNRESAMAKLRQTEKRALLPDEAFLVSSIASTFMKFDFGSDLDCGIMQKFKNKLKSSLPSFLHDWIDHDHFWSGKMRTFMKVIADKRLKVKRTVLKVSSQRPFEGPSGSASVQSTSEEAMMRKLRIIGMAHIISARKSKVNCGPTSANHGMSSENVECKLNQPGECSYLVEGTEDVSENQEDNEFKVVAIETNSKTGSVLPESMVVPEFHKLPKLRGPRRNDCVFKAISSFLEISAENLMEQLFNMDLTEGLIDCILEDRPLSIEMIQEIAQAQDLCIYTMVGCDLRRLNISGSKKIGLILANKHAEPMEMRELSKLVRENEEGLDGAEPLGISSVQNTNFSRVPIDLEAALKLAKSIRRGTTGVMKEIIHSSTDVMKSLECLIEQMSREGFQIDMNVHSIWGVPGSGKSKGLKNFLLGNPVSTTHVISPRRYLADEWVSDLKGTSHKVSTFEVALMDFSPSWKRVLLDEVTLLPPGYMSLILITTLVGKARAFRGGELSWRKFKKYLQSDDFECVEMVTLGDMTQTFYYSEFDSNILEKRHDVLRVIERIEGPVSYLWYSYRAPKCLEAILPYQCLGDEDVEMPKFYADISSVKFKDYQCILVASHSDKAMLSVPVSPLTFGEAQGLTFEKRILIGISEHSMLVGLNGWHVAATRSRKGYDVVVLASRTFEDIKRSSKKRPVEYFISNSRIPEAKMENLVSVQGLNKIEFLGSLEEKAQNDPFILPLIQKEEPQCDQEFIEEARADDVIMKTHLPIVGIDPMLMESFDKMCLKEEREFFHKGRGFSEQFPDTEKGLKFDVLGYPFRFDAIFPRHSASDDVTFLEGVKKRLTFSNPREERRKLEEARLLAPVLLKTFLEKLPEVFEVSQEDIDEGLRSFNLKRSEKSSALWKSHSERSDIDWPLNNVFLFMKSQLCTKEEKMFTTAKAGQTLACFHHAVLFKFGPFLRAIERAFLRACGDSYYIHSAKNFDSLNDFIKLNSDRMDGRSIESDYEAFDASQDATVLAFEEALLKKIGLSSGFISDYVTMKLNLGCRLGSFAIMRFTGEFCTFLFNTFANMLFTFLKYEVNPRQHRILFAGDDMASLSSMKTRTGESESILKKFKLKAKEEVRRLPRFCGWILTPDGIVKSPRLLWARVCLMKQRGLMDQCLDNYFLESKFAYMLGERLFSFLSEKEIEYHYVLTRFFVKNRKKLIGEARRTAYGESFTFGSKCQSLRSTALQVGQGILKLKLIHSVLERFTGMHLSYIRKCSTALGGLRAISKSRVMALTQTAWLASLFLMMRKFKELVAHQRSTPLCTSGLYYSASPQCFQISKPREVWCTCLTIPRWIWFRAISQVMKLTSRKGPQYLLLGQNTFSRALSHISKSVLVFQSQLRMSVFLRVEKLCHLMLAYFTGWRTQVDSFRGLKVKLLGHIKKLLELGTLMLKKRLSRGCHLTGISSNLHLLETQDLRDLEGGSCRLDSQGKGSTVGVLTERAVRRLSLLGQHLTGSIRRKGVSTEKMSVQEVAKSNLREAVIRFLWDNYINTQHVFLPANVDYANLDEAQLSLMRTMLGKFLRPLFGNIAILGSSIKTSWPNVAVQLPQFTLTLNNRDYTFNKELNLHVLIPAIETHRAAHQNHSVSGATFRQLCECFAPEAYAFLREGFQHGVVTNIYKKWPRAFEAAPWVAFDFVGGLDFSKLAPDERKVIDRLTKRLFRTENQKGVYDAGKEVNVDLEG